MKYTPDGVNLIFSKMNNSTGSLIFFEKGKRKEKSYTEVLFDVKKSVAFFKDKGIKKGDRIGLSSKNCYNWLLVDLASLYMGCVIVPFDVNYRNSSQWFLDYYELKVLFLDILDYDHIQEKTINLSEEFNWDLYKPIETKPHYYEPKEIIAFKFTSGTTSSPKAIETQRYSVDDCIVNIQKMFTHTTSDKLLLFMPLYLLQQRFFIYSSILFEYELVLISFEHVFYALVKEQPTVVLGVPHLWETFHKNCLDKLTQDEKLNKAFQLFKAEKTKEKFLPFLNDLGGNIRYCWTGSAPISDVTLDFFETLNIPIYQGYGMSETGIISKNYPEYNKTGSVGKLLDNREIRIDESGEILIKNLFPINTKYYKQETSCKVYLKDGFVATGDIGFVDDDGYLFITGRKKDMIVFSNGKKIWPNKIEKFLETQTAMIKNCIVYGEKQTHLVALLMIREEKNKNDIHKKVLSLNKQLNPDERIINYQIINNELSIENGFLSAQGKIKRDAVYKHYYNEFMNLYKII